jgi:small subunit ribosomal protein S17
VEIERQIKDPKYGKILRRKTICHAHDETNQSHLGDTVRIVECQRRSKIKRWDLVEVVSKSQQVDMAALKAAGIAGEEAAE